MEKEEISRDEQANKLICSIMDAAKVAIESSDPIFKAIFEDLKNQIQVRCIAAQNEIHRVALLSSADSRDALLSMLLELNRPTLLSLFSTAKSVRPKKSNVYNKLMRILNVGVVGIEDETPEDICKLVFNSARKEEIFVMEDNIDQLESVWDTEEFSSKNLLAEAAFWNSKKCIKYLLSKGMKPDAKALMNAVVGGDLELVQYFAECGAPFVCCIEMGIKYFRMNIVRWLVGRGITYNFNLAMKFAIQSNNIQALRMLSDVSNESLDVKAELLLNII